MPWAQERWQVQVAKNWKRVYLPAAFAKNIKPWQNVNAIYGPKKQSFAQLCGKNANTMSFKIPVFHNSAIFPLSDFSKQQQPQQNVRLALNPQIFLQTKTPPPI